MGLYYQQPSIRWSKKLEIEEIVKKAINNTVLSSTKVSISTDNERYPSEPPYSPHKNYPEYFFDRDEVSTEINSAYDGVRNALRLLELDKEHYDSKQWNPFGQFINPGDTVVLKPNFIRDYRETRQGLDDCVITHGSVIRAAVDYVFIALKGKGRIIIADASQNDADFDVIKHLSGLDEIKEFYKKNMNFELEVYDLRPECAQKINGVIVGHRKLSGDPAGYVKVNLGSDSMFAEVENFCHLLYGSEYDTGEIRSHHTGGLHEYLISKTILDADCVINLPKLKTHKKTGITVCMKNLVGINGNKNWLPHHRLGTPAQGGDQFADDGVKHRIEQKTMGYFRRAFPKLGPLRKILAKPAKYFGSAVFGDTNTDTVRSGNWYGNDTTWRMVIDLNRIIMYADNKGTLYDKPARKLFNIVDGIIGGEGNGPLDPVAKPSGVILAGTNALAVDLVSARLMGFDYKKIPLLHKTLEKHRLILNSSEYKKINCISNVIKFNKLLLEFDIEDFSFKPHFGWKGYIEKHNKAENWVISNNTHNNLNQQECSEIVFLGDVALAGEIGKTILANGSEFLFKNIPVEFFDTDLICFNLECCLSKRGEVWEPKPVPLRGLPEFLSVFPKRRCRYIANVANNHFLDFGEIAAFDTLEALRNHGMQYFGLSEFQNLKKYLVINTNAGKIGLIGFAPSVHPLPFKTDVNLASDSFFDMETQVIKLKKECDVAIVSLHQGVENTPYTGRKCRMLTHARSGCRCRLYYMSPPSYYSGD